MTLPSNIFSNRLGRTVPLENHICQFLALTEGVRPNFYDAGRNRYLLYPAAPKPVVSNLLGAIRNCHLFEASETADALVSYQNRRKRHNDSVLRYSRLAEGCFAAVLNVNGLEGVALTKGVQPDHSDGAGKLYLLKPAIVEAARSDVL